VDSEASLFDFTVRAAVSPYGSTQRILLTPTEGDSREVLLAMSQLLLHEMRQLQLDQQQQRQHQRTPGLPPQQQQQQHRLLAATQTSYREFSSLCHQVNQQLPRSQLPVELSSYAEVSPVSPDVAFNVTKGASKSEFAGLALYSHKSYTQLQIVSLEGHSLLKLMNGFYVEAVAARRGGGIAAEADAAAGLAVSEAVETAQEVATLLTSLLEGFMADAGVTSSSSSQASGDQVNQRQQRQQQRQPCRMLMVRDLLGAITYMAKVQQQAAVNTGSTAATKKAAERQAEACAFNAEGIRQGMWLWLLCFLQHGWHLQLCPTARAVETLLSVAGSRCCWLAEGLQPAGGQHQQQQQQQGSQHQQQQEQQARERQQQQGVRQDSLGGCRREAVHEADVAGAAAAAGAEKYAASPAHKQHQQLDKLQKLQQQEKQQGSSFMDWLDDFVEKECSEGKQQQQLPQHRAAAARPTAAAAAAAAAGAPCRTGGITGTAGVQQGRVGAEVIVLETQPDDDDDEVIVLE
jgi:hypothetical protein